MKTRIRTVLVMVVVACAGHELVVHPYQVLLRAQVPSGARIEDRVDNTVRERGVVESSASVELRCDVGGTSTILHVVPEGSRVEKGDLLVQLDDSSLRERLAEAELSVGRSKGKVVQCEAKLASVRAIGAAEVDLAEKALEAALLEKEKVLGAGGELACELAAIESELTVARARLETTEKRMVRTAEDRDPSSLDQLRLDRIEAREAIKTAEARKTFLEKHERKAKTAALELAVAEKRTAVARERQALEAARGLAETELSAAKSESAAQQQKHDRIRRQVERCRIHAPRDGIVVYAAAGASRSARAAVIEPGAQVREGQTLVRLPDMSRLRMRVSVNETRIARVRSGQPATIRIDALPSKEFRGEVVQVSQVPERSSWPNADVREYAVLVSIDGPIEGLHIGLTALVEIDTSDPARP